MMQERPGKPAALKGKDQSVQDHSQGRGGSPEIDSELQAHIGRHLKASYDDILGQDVPDRFLDLLKQLETKETKAGGAEGGEK
jgi:hypothetical protein